MAISILDWIFGIWITQWCNNVLFGGELWSSIVVYVTFRMIYDLLHKEDEKYLELFGFVLQFILLSCFILQCFSWINVAILPIFK